MQNTAELSSCNREHPLQQICCKEESNQLYGAWRNGLNFREGHIYRMLGEDLKIVQSLQYTVGEIVEPVLLEAC